MGSRVSSLRKLLLKAGKTKDHIPWIYIIRKYNQMIFPSLELNKVKRLLNITHDYSGSHCVQTHNEVGQFLEKKNEKENSSFCK